MKEGLLTEEQQKQLFTIIFIEEHDEKHTSKRLEVQLFLLPFFKNRIDDETSREILDHGIKSFQLHHSSSDVQTLYRIADCAERLSDAQLKTIQEEAEAKIEDARKYANRPMTVFQEDTMTTAYLYLLNKLRDSKRISDEDFHHKLLKYGEWGYLFARNIS